jgi:hypothetical protein
MTLRTDLHIHSTASDGDYPPQKIVKLALERELSVIALTDHDTVDGVIAASEAAQGTALSVLNGIEFGCEDERGQVDILGYCLDINNADLRKRLDEMRQFRETRAEKMVYKLREQGILITFERVKALTGDAPITRPRIGQAMVEAGYVVDLNEAFGKYIGDDCPAYVAHYQLLPVDAVTLIHNAGGVAIVAHPGRYKAPFAIIEEFVGYGIDGIEVFYPTHSDAFRQRLLQTAARFNLLTTGGSDFHRPEPNGYINLGDETLSQGVLDALRQKAAMYP